MLRGGGYYCWAGVGAVIVGTGITGAFVVGPGRWLSLPGSGETGAIIARTGIAGAIITGTWTEAVTTKPWIVGAGTAGLGGSTVTA